MFCWFIYFYPTVPYSVLRALLSTWAGPVCCLPPRSFPGSNTLGKLRRSLESLDCSSSATRQIRGRSTFDRKAVLCFLLLLLPLPLFPNRYVNTCIFLFKLSELVLCKCLDLAIGLSLAPPFLNSDRSHWDLELQLPNCSWPLAR